MAMQRMVKNIVVAGLIRRFIAIYPALDIITLDAPLPGFLPQSPEAPALQLHSSESLL
jgi:hypothetical protein